MGPIKQNFNKLYTGNNKLKILDHRYLPRWLVVILDTFLAAFAMVVVYVILKNTPLKFHDTLTVPEQGIVILSITVILFVVFKTYSGIIRHSTFTDLIKVALATFSMALVLFLINIVHVSIIGEKIFLNTSIVLYVLLTLTLMLLFRVAVKESYMFLRKTSSINTNKRVAIYGIDDNTISLAEALTHESNFKFHLVGFFADKVSSNQYRILGKPVIPVNGNIKNAISKLQIESVLIMNDTCSIEKKRQLTEAFLATGIKVYNVPALTDWDKREQLEHEIKPIQIEDLLDRATIIVDTALIKKDLEHKTILVTGGAGSIGSEIVRQVADFKPKKVVVLDQSELSLYYLEIELKKDFPELDFVTELADISNMYRLELLFEKYAFDIVYHAAAYKHVPLIERNPHEAIYVNIMGTVNLSIISAKKKVRKFVMISTDKAVNPTNVMGASKRAAEMYVQALQQEHGIVTRFITTRFGNVLGSSGSVIPLFRKQIAAGGPVTVTHPDIIRYLMTIPEACQLVLQAGTMGNGGEIFAFDMGKPVKIYELAERMIRLSGFEPNAEIKIEIIGLRPGEKLFEELLNNTSKTQPTHHPKILIAKDKTGNFTEVKELIKQIITAATTEQDLKFIGLLKQLVPEYKSENSRFEQLDHTIRHRNVNKTD